MEELPLTPNTLIKDAGVPASSVILRGACLLGRLICPTPYDFTARSFLSRRSSLTGLSPVRRLRQSMTCGPLHVASFASLVRVPFLRWGHQMFGSFGLCTPRAFLSTQLFDAVGSAYASQLLSCLPSCWVDVCRVGHVRTGWGGRGWLVVCVCVCSL